MQMKKCYKNGKKKLEDFLFKISTEKSKPKTRKKQKFPPPIFLTGDCLTFQLQDGNYGGAVVLGDDQTYGFNLVITTRINQPETPTQKDFENSEVLFKTFASWKDEPEVTWLMPYQYKKYADGLLTVIAKIQVYRKYDPNDRSFKATYSSMWLQIIEAANKQFEHEVTNRKSVKRLTVKELIRNKPFWKFW